MKLTLLGTYINTLTRDFHVSDTTKKSIKKSRAIEEKAPGKEF